MKNKEKLIGGLIVMGVTVLGFLISLSTILYHQSNIYSEYTFKNGGRGEMSSYEQFIYVILVLSIFLFITGVIIAIKHKDDLTMWKAGGILLILGIPAFIMGVVGKSNGRSTNGNIALSVGIITIILSIIDFVIHSKIKPPKIEKPKTIANTIKADPKIKKRVIGFFVFLAVIIGVLIFRSLLQKPPAPSKGSITIVDNVVGVFRDDAVRRLKGSYLSANCTEEFNDLFPAGMVVSKSPKSGENVYCYSTVNLVVSKGQSPVSKSQPETTVSFRGGNPAWRPGSYINDHTYEFRLFFWVDVSPKSSEVPFSDHGVFIWNNRGRVLTNTGLGYAYTPDLNIVDDINITGSSGTPREEPNYTVTNGSTYSYKGMVHGETYNAFGYAVIDGYYYKSDVITFVYYDYIDE